MKRPGKKKQSPVRISIKHRHVECGQFLPKLRNMQRQSYTFNANFVLSIAGFGCRSLRRKCSNSWVRSSTWKAWMHPIFDQTLKTRWLLKMSTIKRSRKTSPQNRGCHSDKCRPISSNISRPLHPSSNFESNCHKYPTKNTCYWLQNVAWLMLSSARP